MISRIAAALLAGLVGALVIHADLHALPIDTLTADTVAGAASELPPPVDSEEGDPWDDIPVGFSGQATIVAELYRAHGIEGRRPGSDIRMTAGPRVEAFGGIRVGADLLLTSTGADARFTENVGRTLTQLGLNPTWDWGGAHIGDFSNDQSKFLLSGTRIRGLGLDLNPGVFRLSLQGGRAQRSFIPTGDESVFRRNLVAFTVGAGDERRSHVRVGVLAARDDLSQHETELLFADTLLLDTIPEDLRPRMDTRPQENTALALGGQLAVLGGALVLRGDAAASLVTRDLTAERVDVSHGDLPVSSTVAGLLEGIHPIRLSSAVDHAYEVEARVNVGGWRVGAGYEYVGPGYVSLGLPYLSNDRRGYHADGAVRFLDGRIALNSRYRHQTNNLVDQLRNTVDRSMASTTVSLRPIDRLAASITVVSTAMENDAPGDSMRLDTRSLALSTHTALQQDIFGFSGTVSLGYDIQRTLDGNPFAAVPEVVTHNVVGSVQLPFASRFSVAPSLSLVLTHAEGMEDTRNIAAGFRGTGRFLDGDLRTSVNLSHAISRGQRIQTMQLRAGYPLGWGTDVSLRARHNRYAEFGDRPGFAESTASLSLSRTF